MIEQKRKFKSEKRKRGEKRKAKIENGEKAEG